MCVSKKMSARPNNYLKMKKDIKLRALHVASFNGNIGDLANHIGFRNSFKENTGLEIEYTNLEMRRFYRSWGGTFDEDFIKYANTFDFVIFGGGGFFELKWDYSKSGTTIDLGEKELAAFTVPVLFNALGTSVSKGSTPENIIKFKKFLVYSLDHDNFFVTVRNDGSWELLDSLYGEQITKRILKVPDGGFFYKPQKKDFSLIEEGTFSIAVNIAADMPEIRFRGNDSSGLSEEEFLTEFSVFLERILSENEKNRIIFIPHIFKDMEIISKLMEKISDKYVRTRINSAPYLNGINTKCQELFDLYSCCDLIIGMRYHANVCNIGMGKPCIGICTYEPHLKLFEDLKMSDMCIPANKKGFAENLYKKFTEISRNLTYFVNLNMEVKKELISKNKAYHNEVKKWLINRVSKGEKL